MSDTAEETIGCCRWCGGAVVAMGLSENGLELRRFSCGSIWEAGYCRQSRVCEQRGQRYYVLARSYVRAHDWAKRQKVRNWQYVDCPEDLVEARGRLVRLRGYSRQKYAMEIDLMAYKMVNAGQLEVEKNV